MNPNAERGHKPQGHPVGRPIGSLGKELKPRSKVIDERKDFEYLLNGATPLFELEENLLVDNPPDSLISKEDVMDEAKARLAYMNNDESVKRYLMREMPMEEKDAKAAVAELKRTLKKEFNEYIKTYSEKNIMAVRQMLIAALKRGDIRNSTDIIKALDYMTTKYVENTGVGTNEIEIVL